MVKYIHKYIILEPKVGVSWIQDMPYYIVIPCIKKTDKQGKEYTGDYFYNLMIKIYFV